MKKILVVLVLLMFGCTDKTQEVKEAVFVNEPVVISLNGASVLNVELGTPYIEQGAEVSEGSVVIHGEVDVLSVGVYSLSYSDLGKTVEIERTVHVVDTIAPRLLVREADSIQLFVGEEFVDPGYVLTDADEMTTVEVTGEVGTEIGEYTISYTATDSSGNSTTKKRVVSVVETKVIKPSLYMMEITSRDSEYYYFNDAQKLYAIPYTDLHKLEEGNITSDYIIKRDFSEVGEYYSLHDYAVSDNGYVLAAGKFSGANEYPVIIGYDSNWNTKWHYAVDGEMTTWRPWGVSMAGGMSMVTYMELEPRDDGAYVGHEHSFLLLNDKGELIIDYKNPENGFVSDWISRGNYFTLFYPGGGVGPFTTEIVDLGRGVNPVSTYVDFEIFHAAYIEDELYIVYNDANGSHVGILNYDNTVKKVTNIPEKLVMWDLKSIHKTDEGEILLTGKSLSIRTLVLKDDELVHIYDLPSGFDRYMGSRYQDGKYYLFAEEGIDNYKVFIFNLK